MIQLTCACPALLFPPSVPLATDKLRNHPQPRFYWWQTKAARFSICFSGFWMFFGSADPPSTCCPASTVAPLLRWEKTLQKMWCGIASIQSGCWFQMRSTEFARSNWWSKLNLFWHLKPPTRQLAFTLQRKGVDTFSSMPKKPRSALSKHSSQWRHVRNKPHPEYQIIFWTNINLLARIRSLLEKKP